MSITNFFHKLWHIACFLFLVLVCVGQVYQSGHLHHFHTNDSIAFAVSAHPLAPEPANAQNHHHQEDDSSHEDDNEHNYKKKTDWNVARSKASTNVTFDAPGLPLPVYSLSPVACEKSNPFLQSPSYNKERYVAFLIIRGPPSTCLISIKQTS